MSDGSGTALFFVVVCLYFCTLILDLIGILIVGVYLYKGINEDCSLNAKAYMIAYIIIKIFLFINRALFLGLGWILRDVIGALLIMLSFIIWMLILAIYYVVHLYSFYRGNNNCKDKAPSLYTGILVIAVEAWVIGSIIAAAGGWSGFGCFLLER